MSPQLRYLRTQDNIKESAKSKEIKILEKPLEYGAKVDYDLNKELILETGYLLEGNDKLIASQNLNKLQMADMLDLTILLFLFLRLLDQIAKNAGYTKQNYST